MVFKWLGGLVDSNEKQIQRLQPLVAEINALEPDFKKLSDIELPAKTGEFRAYISQQTTGVNQRLAENRQELDDARQRFTAAENEFQREEETDQIKRLEGNTAQLDKEKRQIETAALEQLLPEAFAAVREAANRTIHQRHFDVQLMGGIVLHQGKIAEMRTGEGKTLVATLPLYLNSLLGRGCHLVTVNDYLSRRDPYWMGPIYHALGISVASIYPQQTSDDYTPSRIYDPAFDSGDKRWPHFRPITRKEAYLADITYGTSSDFGFDYLRDNMVNDLAQCVQRSLHCAVVDEVDNLLIDEARTPLIISGPAEETGQTYKMADDAVRRMKMTTLEHEPVTQEEKNAAEALEEQFDYIAYAKERHVRETTRGQEKMARALGKKVEDLFGGEGNALSFEEAKTLGIFRQSMSAYAIYQKDRHYIVDKDTDEKPGIIIIDEFTGRRMLGRRYAEGLHQAIEAKEGLDIRRESMTYATITIQNYFRMYAKLAGMTGTALTEAEEFHKIYKLDVVVAPTNAPNIRQDFSDRIYKDETSKFKAVVNEVDSLHKKGQPVLIGTTSIENSVMLSELMKRKGIAHHVLNAKEHLKEAEIIARAGESGAVTVATNMAGRGVDIVLGGRPPEEPERPDTLDEKVLKDCEKAHTDWEKALAENRKKHDMVVGLGGLFVIGTERHESRRIDNQLRGRAGRQGDPGSTRFYVSLEDDIMRRFGGDRIKGIMDWAGMDENTPIENKLINKTIENAQVRVEGYYFDVRKHLVEFDDVVNQQRDLIYKERSKLLGGTNLKDNILSMVRDELSNLVKSHIGTEYGEGIHVEALLAEVPIILPMPPEINIEAIKSLGPAAILDKLSEHAGELYARREKEIGPENMRNIEKLIMLHVVDSQWINHLTEMDQQRLQAGWAGLQQVKAVDAYKSLGSQQWDILKSEIQRDVAEKIFHVNIVRQEAAKPPPTPMVKAVARNAPGNTPQKVGGKSVGRNDPCPCGSGKKYKHCHGK